MVPSLKSSEFHTRDGPPPSTMRNLLESHSCSFKLLVCPLEPPTKSKKFQSKLTLKLHRYLNEHPICLGMELLNSDRSVISWISGTLWTVGTLVWGIHTGFSLCKWWNKKRKQIHHVWGAWNATLKKVTYFVPTPPPNEQPTRNSSLLTFSLVPVFTLFWFWFDPITSSSQSVNGGSPHGSQSGVF